MQLPDVTPYYPLVPATRRLSAARVTPVAPTLGLRRLDTTGSDSGIYAGKRPGHPLPPHRGQLIDILV
jgi:hypothetical protein